MDTGLASQPSAIDAAVYWAQQTLTGTLAMTVAIIAMAWFGLMMISGRVPRRRGIQLVLGCFIVFGASTIAAGILHVLGSDADAAENAPSQAVPVVITPDPAQQRPPAAYDPYAGAAVPKRG